LATFSWQDKKKYARASGAESSVSETDNACSFAQILLAIKKMEPLFSAADRPAYFLLLRQKKVAKENEVSAKPKGDPALRYSRGRAAAQLGPLALKQCSPNPPAALRCSALHEGAKPI
jgi:hypothetical protein